MIDKRYYDFVIKRSRITQQFLEVVKLSAFQAGLCTRASAVRFRFQLFFADIGVVLPF